MGQYIGIWSAIASIFSLLFIFLNFLQALMIPKPQISTCSVIQTHNCLKETPGKNFESFSKNFQRLIQRKLLKTGNVSWQQFKLFSECHSYLKVVNNQLEVKDKYVVNWFFPSNMTLNKCAQSLIWMANDWRSALSQFLTCFRHFCWFLPYDYPLRAGLTTKEPKLIWIRNWI